MLLPDQVLLPGYLLNHITRMLTNWLPNCLAAGLPMLLR